MKGFDAKFIDELKLKNDIVDVVGRYVRLDQKGGNFWGKCPFHHEKTASFSVNPRGQFFYCFGCHKSGDVISFIMEIEALDFSDAVRFLAERVNMPLPEIKYDDEKIKEQKKHKQRVLELLRETALFYVKNLRSEKGGAHYEYALKRKFTPETLVKFGFGASLDYNTLPKYLKDKGYTYEEMVSAGAVGEKNGRYFDWLGGRLIIPLIDQFGNVISFAGRRIDGVKEQKYINTRESCVFSKGKTFFNINNLKKAKNETGIDSVILVEGHLDVVSMVQGGLNNVLASMGTAFTKDQARILKRYTDKVIVSFDGDFAGQNATVKGLEILSEEGIDVKVMSLPDGKDPDDVVRELGADGYRRLMAEAMPLIDFKLEVVRRSFNLNTVDGKRKYVTSAIDVIRESASPVEQEDLLKTVRDLTGVTFEALRRELYKVDDKKKEVVDVTPQFTDNVGDKHALAARFVLASYLFNKPYARETDVKSMEFTLPVHKEIQNYILERIEKKERIQFNDLYELLSDDFSEEISRIAGLETEENKTFDQSVYFFDCVRTLKVDKLSREIKRLTELFASETDTEKRKTFTIEMARLTAEKNKLNKG